MQAGMNGWIVSCLVNPASCSTAPPPRPPRPPTCPMQLSWPALALLMSCALRHEESRARGTPQHCSAGNVLASLSLTAPDVSPPGNWMFLTYPVPRYDTVLSHTPRVQKKLEASPHSLTCQKPVMKSSLSKDKVQKDKRQLLCVYCPGIPFPPRLFLISSICWTTMHNQK